MAALVAASAAVLPASAAGLGNGSMSCIGTMTLTFSAPLTLFPAMTTFSMAGGATSCTGLGSGAVSWNGSGLMSLVDDCLVVVGTGSALFNFPGGQATVNVTGGGPSLLQSWTFSDTSGLAVQASGLFAWINVPQITGCLTTTNVTSMTLTGAFEVVT